MSRKYKVDRDARASRRRRTHTVKRSHSLMDTETGEVEAVEYVSEVSAESAELAVVIAEMSSAFKSTIDFYKVEHGGGLTHEDAVRAAEEMQQWRRKRIKEGIPAREIGWTELAALGEVSLREAAEVWSHVREAAAVELESGARSAQVIGGSASAWAFAEFVAIRDAFIDEWQPRGGIETAMIDMLAVAFSLQMYWATIAHERATRAHDEQRKDTSRYESAGWKSPYQSAADATEQANRFADGYNRQFLRVLRQLRDLRRYAPSVIVNNGGQVNVATDGGQQVNISK
ncbi:MAG: hypothetical protein QOE46_2933 [Acidobacteriota bacterium]|nr:hypothetical protein [Acidobacteriota bacterium]